MSTEVLTRELSSTTVILGRTQSEAWRTIPESDSGQVLRSRGPQDRGARMIESWRDKPGTKTTTTDIPERFIRAFTALPAPQEVQRKAHIDYNSPLDQAGFEVQKDVNGFESDYQKALIEGKTKDEAFQIVLSERVANIRTYILEYARQGLVLPHLIDLENGKLVNSHNRQAIIPRISVQERGGAVKLASERMENFFANTQEGTAVNTSPKGKTGFFNKDGEEFEYFNCETFIYSKKADGSFEGVSLVSDMTLAQNKELMRRLGVSMDVLMGYTESEEIEGIVNNPALLSPNLGYSISPEKIMEMILDIRGGGDIRLINAKGKVEYRPVSEMKRDLARRGYLLLLNTECEAYMDDFIKTVTEAFGSKEYTSFMNKLALELERVIFKITRQVKLPFLNYSLASQSQYGGYNDLSEREVLLREYAPEIMYLKESAGCASVGGNRVTSRGFLSGILNSGNIGLDSEAPGKSKTCLSCGEKNNCTKECYKCGGILA